MDRRIVLQQFTESAADAETNEKTKTWSTLATVWAKRFKKKSGEVYEAKQQVAVTLDAFMIRYRTDVTERMRVVDGDATYDITGIEEGASRQSYLILSVVKRDNA